MRLDMPGAVLLLHTRVREGRCCREVPGSSDGALSVDEQNLELVLNCTALVGRIEETFCLR